MGNSLSAVHPELASEWSYKNLPLTPDKITYGSNKIVWWRCSLGHSWRAKVVERTVEGKGCKVCERDYLTAFPKLAVMFYAGQKRLQVETECTEVIGIVLENYIPDEKVAIETSCSSEEIEILKEHLCSKRNIKRLQVPYKIGDDDSLKNKLITNL